MPRGHRTRNPRVARTGGNPAERWPAEKSSEHGHYFVSGPPNMVEGAEDLPPGPLGRFDVLRRLGTGNGTAVYLAEDTVRSEEVALKVVHAGPHASEALIERIKDEVRMHSTITDYRYVIRVHDVHVIPRGGANLLVISMEFADGGTFRDWLGNCEKNPEQCIAEGLPFFRQACLGVAAAHEARLPHLDLKPENLLFAHGVLKVSDFGVAALAHHVFAGRTGSIAAPSCPGTPAYMSPEQFRPARKSDVGVASDIYSLGVVLYELLDGSPPFDGDYDELRDKHLTLQPRALNGPAGPWWPVAKQCLAKDPTRRYASVEHLLADLDRASRGATLSADVSCGRCGHINLDNRREKCEACGTDISRLFRDCITCLRRNRLDIEKCGGCGFDVARHYWFEDHRHKVAKLQDEDPAAAIEMLEAMLRRGASDKEAVLIRELRANQTKITPWIAQAQKAHLAGDCERALDLWKNVLQVVPRHRLALGNSERIRALQNEFRRRRAQALEWLECAKFEDAEILLRRCLELVPESGEIRELLRSSSERSRKYGESLRGAAREAKRKMIREAACHVDVALQQAPKSPTALTFKEKLARTIDGVRELLADARQRLARAAFGPAEQCVRAIEERQADNTELKRFKRELATSKSGYREAMAAVERALGGRELDRAIAEAQVALKHCPESPETLRLADSARQDQERARGHLARAEELRKSADFAKALDHLCHVRELWPAHDDIQTAEDQVASTEQRYQAAMTAARRALERNKLAEARSACSTARRFCPDAQEAVSLETSIRSAEERAEARRESIRAVAAATFKWAGIAIGIAAALGITAFCLYSFYRWLGSSLWPWLKANQPALICLILGVLAATVGTHALRYTNLFRRVYKDSLELMPANQFVGAVIVLGVAIGLSCSAVASIVSVLMGCLGVAYGQARMIGLIVCILLDFAALLHALFCRCDWCRL